MDEHRKKALETALSQIEKQFGQGPIIPIGTDERPGIEFHATGPIPIYPPPRSGGRARVPAGGSSGPEASG